MSLVRVTRSMAGLAFQNGIGRNWISRRLQQSRAIVYYHWIGDRTAHYAEFYRGCTLDRFRKDLQFLCSHFKVRPLNELIAEKDRAYSRGAWALTFDDGFDLSSPELLQTLADFKVTATTLITTACLDNQHLMWRNKLSVIRETVSAYRYLQEYNRLMREASYPEISSPDQLMSASFEWRMSRKDELATELWNRCGLAPVENYLAKEQPYFTRKTLKTWLQAGHSVGLHTHTHPRCSRLSREEIETEIVEPARRLKQEFQLEQLPFSYPFGDRLSPDIESEVIAAAGLSCALGIQGFSSSATPPLSLEREGLEKSGADWVTLGKALLRGIRKNYNARRIPST
ncbi:MAG TPA: polysaccharide deacetylase family protein [Verrucomicrobiae bacterium]|nr:polysaccharide deacetylase family protein [Verrucomicrobiae bacterium]